MKKLFVFVTILLVSACSKEDDNSPAPPAEQASINISITHQVDQLLLFPDSMLYINEAGNNYSITRLQYYLSEIDLIRSDSSTLRIQNFRYVDAMKNPPAIMNYIPSSVESFIGIRFFIGLTPSLNVSYSLPAVIENIDMQWPEYMGGGYHFLKMEGNFSDGSSNFGYAMHLGTDTCRIPVACWKNFTFNNQQSVNLSLTMNINEWYRNPSVYNFNTDGNYIMGVVVPMLKLKNNASDVFTLN